VQILHNDVPSDFHYLPGSVSFLDASVSAHVEKFAQKMRTNLKLTLLETLTLIHSVILAHGVGGIQREARRTKTIAGAVRQEDTAHTSTRAKQWRRRWRTMVVVIRLLSFGVRTQPPLIITSSKTLV